ncbi:MAG: hypothetical protein QXQ53_06980, partial [Candidatus Methanosuratincola sp.]
LRQSREDCCERRGPFSIVFLFFKGYNQNLAWAAFRLIGFHPRMADCGYEIAMLIVWTNEREDCRKIERKLIFLILYKT